MTGDASRRRPRVLRRRARGGGRRAGWSRRRCGAATAIAALGRRRTAPAAHRGPVLLVARGKGGPRDGARAPRAGGTRATASSSCPHGQRRRGPAGDRRSRRAGRASGARRRRRRGDGARAGRRRAERGSGDAGARAAQRRRVGAAGGAGRRPHARRQAGGDRRAARVRRRHRGAQHGPQALLAREGRRAGARRARRGGGCWTLLLSDVVGDDPATIASGPTVADPTTFADALAVLDRWLDRGRRAARACARTSQAGRDGRDRRDGEARRPGAARARRARVSRGNRHAPWRRPPTAARRLGYEPHVDRRAAARRRGRGAGARSPRAWLAAPRDRPVAIVAGGETTVRVVPGRARRALAAAGARRRRGARRAAGRAARRGHRRRRRADRRGRRLRRRRDRRPRAGRAASTPAAALAATDSHRAAGRDRRPRSHRADAAPTSPTWWSRCGPRASAALAMPARTRQRVGAVRVLPGRGRCTPAAASSSCASRGCPLRCRWCDTPDSLVPVAECRILGVDGAHVRPNPLAARRRSTPRWRALRAASPPLHAIAVTGGEPLAQVGVPRRAGCDGARDDLPVLLETAGILPARLARVLPFVAIVQPRLQVPQQHRRAGALGRARGLPPRSPSAAGRDVYVKMPVDETTDPDEVEHGARLAAAAGPAVPLFLTPLTAPQGDGLQIGPARLERLHALASRHHPRRPRPAPAAQGPRHPVRHAPARCLTHRDRRRRVG